MKKSIVLLAIQFTWLLLPAQKKVTAETRSSLMAIDIPVDAKADNRLLSKVGVGIILTSKIQPLQLNLMASEYFFWKGNGIKEARSAGIIDSLIKSLTANNWVLAYDDKDDKVMWLLKDNKPLILMYVTAKKQIDLYIGELNKAPPVNFQ